MRSPGTPHSVAARRREAAPRLSPANACAFLELHIEQGPVLVAEGAQVAIPTTIRGNLRWPGARCLGRYDHSGATPRDHRQDTVLAAAELVRALEAFWIAQEESCLLYTSPSPRDGLLSRMPSSA